MQTPHKRDQKTGTTTVIRAPRPHSLRKPAVALAFLAAILAQTPVFGADAARTTPKLSAAMVSHQLQLQLRGASNQIYRIETSTNLVNWTVLAQRAGGPGTVTINDPQAALSSHRYYRLEPGQPNNLTALGADGFAPDKILVKPKTGATLSALNLTLGVNVLHVFSAIGNLQVVQVPSGTTADTLIAKYEQSGSVVYAEPDYYLHALATPDDPGYPELWGFHNTGQFGGVTNSDIDAPDAWDIQHDASNIIVAVVDTGVRYTHEDLAADMWVNPADGSHGTNVVAGNNDPNDDYGHGTHVAGTIGAVGNNGKGVVGVAWHAQLMACKFLDSTGNGTVDGAIACLDYARQHGAKIVNASWGANNFTSQALHDAFASLRDAGIIVVAAAGNNGENDDDPSQAVYPAGYSDLDNIIAVAATDPTNELASFSAYGATNVDLGAPGVMIGSTYNNSDSDYEYDDGTSMAAAMVSGAVAVMEAHFPNESYLQIKQQIMANVDSLPSLQGKCVSGGRLNLYKALTGGSPPPPTLTANFSANPTSGQTPLTVQFTDASTGGPTSWDWSFGDGSADSTAQNPSHTYTNAGNFTVTLTVANGSGQTSSASQIITATGTSNNVPVITLTATQPDAYASGEVPGTVTFHRTGDTSQAYEVYWSFSGTASNGVDYGLNGAPYPTNSPFPAGQSDATLTITPIDHGQTNDETVIVTVAPGSAYQIGASNSATIIIHGHQPSSGPVASFTASPTSGQAPLTVQFTDTSTGSPTAWNWNFGDGSADSTAQNPSHTYSSAGNFTASLTVTGSSGQTSSTSQTITVTNAPAPVSASFTASPTSGQAPLAVQFTDTSTGSPTAWNWDFGDGATSTAQNPSHTYTSAGNFTASLTVTGSSGQTSSTSQTITVTNAPPPPVSASFTANPTSGQAPLAVQFTDTSTGSPTAWNWNFGDGASSTAQNPSHTYSSAGNFTASLTVTGSSGQTSSTSQTITVTNAPPPPVSASFTANPTSGQAPLTVQFTDTSTGSPVSWDWNFGDGSADSTAQNPSHTYTSAGNFTASLTVTGSDGQTSSASRTIVATNPPPALATVTVAATQPLATSLTPGVFTISRADAGTGSALTVDYSLGGTAQNGADYQALSGEATIPAGENSTTVTVQPIGLLTVLKTVVLTVSPESTYNVGSPNSATVQIVVSLPLQ